MFEDKGWGELKVMVTWKTNLKSFWITLWRYLEQPLFDKNSTVILDPWKFDRHNKIQFLEDCWKLDYSSKEKYS